MKTLLCLFSLFFCISNAIAAPFIYKCGKNGRYEKSISPKEIRETLKAFVTNSKTQELEAMVSKLCEDKKECVEEFGNLLRLTNQSNEIIEQSVNTLLKKFKFNTINKDIHTPINISDSDFNLIKNYNDLNEEIYMCHEEKKKLDISDFVFNDKAIMFYPYHTNYMYMTGCSYVDAPECNNMMKVDLIKKSIARSISMGADPYTAIAINMLEKFNHDFDTGLVWDLTIPARLWLTNAMNCPRNIPEKGVTTKGLFKLSSRLNSFLETTKSTDLLNKNTKEKSFLCYDGKENYPNYSTKSKNGQCCLQLNMNAKKGKEKSLRRKLQSALMFEYIRQQTYPNKTKKFSRMVSDANDPAAHIQRYNGYSALMGGAEPVTSWRAGTNHYKDPVYGYQVMDYIINSIITNPLINNLVEKEKIEQGKNVRSLICATKNPGIYVVDTEYYKNKHRDSKRLLKIINKKNTDWTNLTNKEKKVMLQELSHKDVKKILQNINEVDKSLVGSILGLKFESIKQTRITRRKSLELANNNPQLMSKLTKYYFSNIHEKRMTRGQASNYTWEKLDKYEVRKLALRMRGMYVKRWIANFFDIE